MSWLFSKRCKSALDQKKIIVSLPSVVRNRILFLLRNFNEVFHISLQNGWNEESSVLDQLLDKIKEEHGVIDLKAFVDGKQGVTKKANIDSFVLRGNYPPYLFDALEVFYNFLDNKVEFQKQINSIMEESKLPWRMAEGKIYPIDSSYIEEEIIAKAYQLLKTVKFEGAVREFEQARIDLVNGDYYGAIQNANLAVESTLKGVLNIERAKPGELFNRAIESGIIPEYFSGFLKSFEENILRSVAIIRNNELGCGHGQGKDVNLISPCLAELAVNMTGILVKYLISKSIEKDNSGKKK